MKIWDWIKQLLFPLRCPVCDEPARPFGEKICPECRAKRKILTQPYCMKCGKRVLDDEEFCGDCVRTEHLFVRGRALYEYEFAAPSIYRLKYAGRQEYAGFFGEEMAEHLENFVRSVKPDALVPIPLHKSRKRRRGYNQASLLAKELGACLDIPVLENYLLRIKNTRPLKRLNPAERQNNLKKAFIIGRNDVKLNTVILVDDIYTTGSTMDEAAKTLLKGGVQKVYFVTLACGEGV